MKKNIIINALLMLVLSSLISCRGIINDHFLEIEDNQIISTSSFSDKFGLPFSGNFPIIIKEVDYGAVDLLPKTQSDDFSIRVTADLSSFNSDLWDGFGPIENLPNGAEFPVWVETNELIEISIPTFTDLFSLDLIVGLSAERFYVGINLNIKAIDEYYPEGLNISQEIKNNGSRYPYAAIYAYGPTYDDNGQKVQNSGITVLSSFEKPNN